jgi:hypothetical protein
MLQASHRILCIVEVQKFKHTCHGTLPRHTNDITKRTLRHVHSRELGHSVLPPHCAQGTTVEIV